MGAMASLLPMNLGLFGDFQETQSQQAELEANATLAEKAAADATLRGMAESSRERTKGTQQAAAQFVAYANSGVDPTQGTAARTQEWTKAVSELDAQTMQNNAAREAWGYKTKAAEMRTESKNAGRRFGMKTVGTVLGSVGKMQGGGFGGG